MRQRTIRQNNFSFTLSLHQWLLASCSFSTILLGARLIATGEDTFIFLLWNLFLAFMPFAISHWLYNNTRVIENKWKLMTVLAAWLLFIPNSFYILTDLFHLEKNSSAPKWFDLLLLLSFAWNGLLFGILSLRKIEMILLVVSGRSFSLFIVFAVMWLNAFGIYLGRFLRYNSWDVVMQPFSLFGEMFEILFHPIENRMEWGMISCYAVFMTLLYITIKKLPGNFSQFTNKK